MLLKSGKFIGVYFGVWLSILFAACSANTSPRTIIFQNADINNDNLPVSNENKIVETKGSKNLDCSDPSKYSFVVVENPNRKDVAESPIPKDLNIVFGEEVVAKIKLPVEAKNFSLSSVENTKTGFEINVEWGGGKYHYEIQFNFKCKENNFYLYKIKNENFSTTNPDSGNFWNKKETEETKIEPNLPIENFVMLDYLQ